MFVISTAGHVDHGKSTLIRHLTGIDPDRLVEEKERGLTIDLGYAWLTLPSGREIGIVDVPGHERFVHNMLAGVSSVDATLLVVAASEGWMPQSEEHLAILDMLGARHAVVALTKVDLVDLDRVETIAAQVRARLAGTTLEGSPVVAVSGQTGDGVAELRLALDRVLDENGEVRDRGRPRAYLDRVFTVKGVGTVVTGTLTGGSLRTGDRVVVLPAGHHTRIRGLQTHKTVREVAEPVSRVAMNLAGIETGAVARGDAVVCPGQWEPASQLDVRLRAVRSLDHGLGNRGAYKAYVGSAEIDARLTLLDATSIGPGEQAFARIVLAHPVVAAPFDRFVLRDVGRRQTVAGGAILDAHPPGLRNRNRADRIEQLRARSLAGPDDIPTLLVQEQGWIARTDLERRSGSGAAPRGTVSLRTLETTQETFDRTAAAIEEALGELHARLPLVRGASREDVRAAAGQIDERLFAEVVEAIPDRIVAEGPILRLAAHEVVLTLEQKDARDVLLRQLAAARFSPPSTTSLMDAHGDHLVRALVEAGDLVPVGEDVVLTAELLGEAKRIIAEATEAEGALTAARIKELLGTTRKYAIPLLEHLDRTGFTRRVGDLRELVR
ncbi:MAG TPA: selenocysteine-specific translation elongation factor [Actinomycetota bacterium]